MGMDPMRNIEAEACAGKTGMERYEGGYRGHAETISVEMNRTILGEDELEALEESEDIPVRGFIVNVSVRVGL